MLCPEEADGCTNLAKRNERLPWDSPFDPRWTPGPPEAGVRVVAGAWSAMRFLSYRGPCGTRKVLLTQEDVGRGRKIMLAPVVVPFPVVAMPPKRK